MNHQTRIEYLAQADLIFLVSDLLRPPTPKELFAPSDEELAAAVGAAGMAVQGAFHQLLIGAIAQRRECPHEELSDEFNRLFEGATVCPPNETAYIRRDKGAIIADLCGFYRAFGLSIDGQSGEKPDHLLTELEFVAAALTMAAEAEDPPQRATAVGALAQFATSHLNDWLPAFCHHLSEVSFLPCFQTAGGALGTLWRELSALHCWPMQEPENYPVPEAESEAPCECGAIDALEDPSDKGKHRRPLKQLRHSAAAANNCWAD